MSAAECLSVVAAVSAGYFVWTGLRASLVACGLALVALAVLAGSS